MSKETSTGVPIYNVFTLCYGVLETHSSNDHWGWEPENVPSLLAGLEPEDKWVL
jgi:hypothetical protein